MKKKFPVQAPSIHGGAFVGGGLGPGFTNFGV
jgi:hypothetical protein